MALETAEPRVFREVVDCSMLKGDSCSVLSAAAAPPTPAGSAPAPSGMTSTLPTHCASHSETDCGWPFCIAASSGGGFWRLLSSGVSPALWLTSADVAILPLAFLRPSLPAHMSGRNAVSAATRSAEGGGSLYVLAAPRIRRPRRPFLFGFFGGYGLRWYCCQH